MKIIKKDGVLEDYNEQKIIDAVYKSAQRAMCNLDTHDYSCICNAIYDEIAAEDFENDEIPVYCMHSIVEQVLLELYPKVGQCYQQYRNYKLDFVKMMDEVYKKSQTIRYIGDVSNANSDATMVSTQRSLIYGQLNKELYKKFFLNQEERQTVKDGYIYVHDMKDRLDSINCCLFDMESVLKGGFESGNIWYNEPKTLDTAFDVIGDVIMSAASQQYGGFTVVEFDKLLSPYAEKSYNKYVQEITNTINLTGVNINNYKEEIDKKAYEKVKKDFEQGFQGLEYKLNSVASSRGDYPFTTLSFGLGTGRWEVLANEIALKVRMNGQGKEGYKKPVLFPKLTFLYDENLHGKNKELEKVFDAGVECSQKAMYPDYLSLTGDGYIPSIYKKYGKVISLMGKCKCSPCKTD